MLGEEPTLASPSMSIQSPDDSTRKSNERGGGNDKDKEPKDSVKANVRRWCERISVARKKWETDFKRMRENMDFVAGIQYSGQKDLLDVERYICNLTLRIVNQGVAMVYARDPKVEARLRKRLDFKIWDGNMEDIQMAMMQAQQFQMMGLPVPPELMMLMQDFQAGRMRQKILKKVAETLEVLYQYQLDSQSPRFKLQMKQLVRRIRTCGVGYIKTEFCRNYENDYLTQSETRMSITDRMKMAKELFEKLQADKITEQDADVEQLKSLIASLNMDPLDNEVIKVKEHLIFDFPRATSIIPDPNTRTLKGFVGARWLVEEVFYPLDFVNAFFETDIKPGGELKMYDKSNQPDLNTNPALTSGEKQDSQNKRVCLWNVWNLDAKENFILCEGYNDYVMQPESVTPATKGFWNIVAFTFNDIEVEEGCKATIFPPSDVDLIKSAQKEWNRTRESLKRHRKANAPRYMYPNGLISEEDLDRIEDSDEQQFIPIKGVPPGQKLSDVLVPLNVVAINQSLYTTEPLREDTLLATGQQEANIGPAQPNVTATVGNIAEQSRMSVSASDIDGLDDGLTEVAQIGGEMLLREASQSTVQHVVGEGAVWPEQNRADFINELELEFVAASSGRPNKAVDISNWQMIAPILQGANANPQALIRETIKRAGDHLEPSDFFPLPLPVMAQPPGGSTGGGNADPNSRPVAKRNPETQPAQGGPVAPGAPPGVRSPVE